MTFFASQALRLQLTIRIANHSYVWVFRKVDSERFSGIGVDKINKVSKKYTFAAQYSMNQSWKYAKIM